MDDNETIAAIIAEMRKLGKLDEKSIDEVPRTLLGLGLRTYADRIEAAWKRELGDAAKLREALKQVNELNDLWFDTFTLPDGATSIHDEIEDVISAALAAPPRNCDVGTAEEQWTRVRAFCKRYKTGLRCVDCPVNGVFPKRCALIWAQMPYKEGGAK